MLSLSVSGSLFLSGFRNESQQFATNGECAHHFNRTMSAASLDVVEIGLLLPVVPLDSLLLHFIDFIFPTGMVGSIHALPFLKSPHGLIIAMQLAKDDAFPELGLVPGGVDLQGALGVFQNLLQLELLVLKGEARRRAVGEGDVAVGVPLQGPVVALGRGPVLALTEIGVAFRLLLDGLVIPKAVQDHLLVRIVSCSTQVVIAWQPI